MGIGFMKRSMIPYATVTVTAQTGGSASGGGKFIKKKTATVTAVANSGYIFAGWYAGGVLLSGSLTYTFAVLGNITLEARFRTPVVGEPGTSADFYIYYFGVHSSGMYYSSYGNGAYPKRIVVTYSYQYGGNAASGGDVFSAFTVNVPAASQITGDYYQAGVPVTTNHGASKTFYIRFRQGYVDFYGCDTGPGKDIEVRGRLEY